MKNIFDNMLKIKLGHRKYIWLYNHSPKRDRYKHNFPDL